MFGNFSAEQNQQTIYTDVWKLYLGHCVTSDDVAPAEAKVQSIRSAELLRTKRQLRRYSGCISFMPDI